MSVTYLLPCACGKHIPIEGRQAGENVVCLCGAKLQAPTLLRMADLEVVRQEAKVATQPATWNWSHRLMLAGTVLVVAAILLGLLLHAARPIAPAEAIDPERIRATAKELPPITTWNTWEVMKEGLDRRTNQAYLTAMLYFRVWQTGIGLLAVVGAVSFCAGLWSRRRS